MLQNCIGSLVREGKNFETQRREGFETRRHEDTKARSFFKKIEANKWKELPTLNH
jgi:hypothetical protein